MLAALVLAAVTAVIASSFLFRAAQEARLASRSYFQSVALNLAEAGIEEGLYASNTTALDTANGWSLITGTTDDYSKTITSGFDFQQATGEIYIRVDGGTTLTPTVLAAGVIRIPQQPPMMKQIRVVAGKRQLWSNGLVVKNTLTFSGTTSIDSYDSNLGPFNSSTNRSDQATVATTSTALDPIVVGSNASIYGYVATGAAEPEVGSGGTIYGSTTPSGTLVDTSRIRHDFTANLPDVTAPTGTAISLGAISTSISLPRVGDPVGANGRYLYSASSLSAAGTEVVTVTDDVDLIVTGSISMTGNSSLVISGISPSLNIYCPGNITLSGNGVVNSTNVPSNMTIWGTAPSSGSQTITVGGNGSYTGTIYAPNADATLNGNGGTSGAVIAKSAVISGNGEFHYDIRLGGLPTSLDPHFRPSTWCELTATAGSGNAFARDNRTPFATLF
ncbi:MAG: hypothetical protein Q7S40_25100 [Opitutaceae bacterium]|nr:hypothetical protein [Opitutaceae bacterium]